jgi:replicative DNA helicase
LVTDAFLNSCFSLILSQSNIRKDKALYRDIVEILNFRNKKNNQFEVPILLKNKIECLDKICKLKLDDKTDDSIIDSLSFSEKYISIIPSLELKRKDILKDKISLDFVRQVRLRKKLNSLLNNYDKLYNVMETVRDSSFESIDDLIIDYEATVKLLYSNMVEQNRITAIEATSSLDLIKDDFKPMLDKIVEKYDRKNTTPTGYTIFDDYVFNGGFERSRLYIFAGTAGSGKSTLMGNLIINSARKSSFMYDQNENKKDGIYKVYIYITLENTIEEAFMRIYQSLYNKKTHDVLNDIINGVNIKKMIVDEFEKNNATIIMKYFKPGMVSCTDLMVVLDDVIEEYGQLAIKGLYVDYLDVLRNDTRYDVKWMEIGEIALSLKLLAVDYNIPVITPTHLDRSAYTAENIKNINLGNLAKSIQKAEHGDTVCIQINDQFDPKIIHTKVIKNRSGRSNIAIDFNVDFDYYKFINGFRADGEKLNNQESYNNIIDYSDNSSNGF